MSRSPPSMSPPCTRPCWWKSPNRLSVRPNRTFVPFEEPNTRLKAFDSIGFKSDLLTNEHRQSNTRKIGDALWMSQAMV